MYQPFIPASLVAAVVIASVGTPATALAETLYPCQIDATSKTEPNASRTIDLPLLKTRTNRLDLYVGSASRTLLDLRVGPEGQFTGFVNGQPQFKLEGNVTSGGSFESATAFGRITCGAPQEESVVFYFRPWRTWYLPEYHSFLKSVRIDSGSNLCFIGSAADAAERAAAQSGGVWKKEDLQLNIASQDPREHFVMGSRTEQRCLKRSNIDADCEVWSQPYKATYTMKHCDSRERDHDYP